jgi:hypothetical protein
MLLEEIAHEIECRLFNIDPLQKADDLYMVIQDSVQEKIGKNLIGLCENITLMDKNK